MSCNEVAISITNLGKCYEIYKSPSDRLKQFMLPSLQKKIGIQPRIYFKEFWALKNVSLEIKKGETVGILGRNGCGKSTLLQMICGTLTPTEGEITTNGRIAALLELGSGFNPEFTGRENVYLNATVLGLTTAEINQRFSYIVAFADIGDFIEQPVKTYSSGMMVRLAFAVIAHVDADILIIDEALSVGDAFFTRKCMNFLRKFMQTGTVLFVSHDINSVKSLCNNAVWLEKGEIIKKGTPKEICELYLEAFYEEQQGASTSTKLKPLRERDHHTPVQDQRSKFINSSNLRNDLEVFQFNPNAASFGKGGATIHSVAILDEHQSPLRWIVGGEMVSLQINIDLKQNFDSPIVGFFVKDKLGQSLFGDNTYLTYKENNIGFETGQEIQIEFAFMMPLLPSGDYSVTVAIANGTQDQHVQHHWIHDALQFKSMASSVAAGLIGIPMIKIQMHSISI